MVTWPSCFGPVVVQEHIGSKPVCLMTAGKQKERKTDRKGLGSQYLLLWAHPNND